MSVYHRARNGVESPDWTIVVGVPGSGGRRITRTVRGTRKDAERIERDLLAAVEADRWAEIDRTRLRAVVTLQNLADEWTELGLPKPGGRARDEAQQDRLRPFLRMALTWWGPKSPAGIGPKDFEAFGAHKRANARSGTGERAADLELVALHNLCTWAVSTGRLTANPFATRPQYRASTDVTHCSAGMPADDDELHRLIGFMFGMGDDGLVAGAHLLFQALTGLRPGEPGALRWDAVGDQPGARLTITREGGAVVLMRVRRLKGGINPAVRIHPALAAFLGVWREFTARRWRSSPWLFPNPKDLTQSFVPFGHVADSHLGRLLADAAKAVGLGPRKPHGMRAYYVRVRRSMGIDDATIAVELGQGSGPGLVVRTYGERFALLGGDGLFDWLPASPTHPCWDCLTDSAPSNIIAISNAA